MRRRRFNNGGRDSLERLADTTYSSLLLEHFKKAAIPLRGARSTPDDAIMREKASSYHSQAYNTTTRRVFQALFLSGFLPHARQRRYSPQESMSPERHALPRQFPYGSRAASDYYYRASRLIEYRWRWDSLYISSICSRGAFISAQIYLSSCWHTAYF